MTHRIAHAALACVYVTLFMILAHEGAWPHAGCALAAALIYLVVFRAA